MIEKNSSKMLLRKFFWLFSRFFQCLSSVGWFYKVFKVSDWHSLRAWIKNHLKRLISKKIITSSIFINLKYRMKIYLYRCFLSVVFKTNNQPEYATLAVNDRVALSLNRNSTRPTFDRVAFGVFLTCHCGLTQ